MRESGDKGYTDRPKSKIDEDIFEIKEYIEGLSKFIRQCPTPMTISIQGDWGSGKTSFMNMIEENLADEVYSVWLNTWQFSQFNLGDSLPIMLLTKLVDTLSGKGKLENDAKKAVSSLAKAGLHVLAATATSLSGIDMKGAADKLIAGLPSENVTESISKLKEHFQKCVDDCLKEKEGKTRVLIFVDDLDRLHPAKAVELLEVLKLFLDCDKCVFILAIDYEVVIQGVNQKYGGALSYDKGRNFFDKIIQLPFKMPVAQYKIKNYVEATLKDMGISTEKIEPYVNLIRYSVGYNPRGMKRLFNAFLLLRIINKGEDKYAEIYDRTLFAVLCLQISFEDIYNYIVNHTKEEIGQTFFDYIVDSETIEGYYKSEDGDTPVSAVPAWVKELKLLNDEDRTRKVCTFMARFCETVAEDGKTLSENDYERVFEVLSMASVTSVSDISVGDSKTGRATRYEYTMDKEFEYHSVGETVEKSNEPNGWNKSEINGFKLFGEEKKVSNFAEAVTSILKILYERDPDKFIQVRSQSKQNGLGTLFNGSKKDGIAAPNKIPGTNILIESKTNYNKKVSDLKKVIEALGYNQSDLELLVKLAHR